MTANSSPTRRIDVDGMRFAYREFGPAIGVPVEAVVGVRPSDPPYTTVVERDGSSDRAPRARREREDDRMLPTRSSFDLAHQLPNASQRIYPDAGHGGVFQCHERFVGHALEFLSSSDNSQPRRSPTGLAQPASR